jgi:hypothetical protein
MTLGEKYRLKAAEFQAKADQETRPLRRNSFQSFVRVYQRLASQADRSAEIKNIYEAILPPRNR